MRAIAVTLISLMAVPAFIGCAALRQLTHRWEGKQFDEVVAARGAPTSSYQLSNGNTVYTYNRGSTAQATSGQTWAGQRTVTVSASDCLVHLEVSPNGTVLKQSQDGDCR